jgi:hypothetical protein
MCGGGGGGGGGGGAADGLGAGVETDNRWLTVRGSQCFKTGKHFWTLALHSCKSNNFFLGVCAEGAKFTNYLGSG